MSDSPPTIRENGDVHRQVVDVWLTEFERTWSESRLDSVVTRLPPSEHPLHQVLLLELAKADLKRHWQEGTEAHVESYLTRFPELGTPETVDVELVQVEYEARQASGSPASWEEFARRFPSQTADLRRQLDPEVEAATEPDNGPHSMPTILPLDELMQGMGTPPTNGNLHSEPAAAPPQSPSVLLPRIELAAGPLPEEFGRYKIIRILGRGGMGSVYLAHDTQLDRPVALKVPLFTPNDNASIARFYREARAAATLQHANICPVHDVGEFQGVPYLTMAYIEGQSLRELTHGKPLAQRRAAEIVRQLARALEEAHSHGVVHRDLKPSNVLMNPRGEPVIMDFGLARKFDKSNLNFAMSQSGMFEGTPAYMAPERIKGDAKADGRGTDIYSLGVMMFELLTGKVPFEGPVPAIVAKIMFDPTPQPSDLRPDLDPRLEAICLKAMASEVADRYATMSELAEALDEYLREEKPALFPPRSVAVILAGDSEAKTQIHLSKGQVTDPIPDTFPSIQNVVQAVSDATPSEVALPVKPSWHEERRGLPMWLKIIALAMFGAGAGAAVFLFVVGRISTRTTQLARNNGTRPIETIRSTTAETTKPAITKPAPTTRKTEVSKVDEAKKAKEEARQQLKQAQNALIRANHEQALRHAEEALRLDRQLAAAYQVRGRVYQAQGNLNKAIEDYNDAINRTKDPNAELFKERGLAYLERKDLDPAIDDLSQTLRLDPNDAAALAGRGRAYLFKKEYGKAIKDLNDAVKYDANLVLNPQLAEAYNGRGLVYREQKDYERAEKDFAAAMQLAPKLETAYLNLGDVYRDKEEYDRAIGNYRDALMIDPKSTQARSRLDDTYQRLSESYFIKKNYNGAVTDFNQRVGLDDDNVWAHYYRGRAYQLRREGDYVKQAIDDYTKTIQLDPKYAMAYRYRGDLYAQQQNYENALSDLSNAIKLQVDDPLTWYQYAHLLIKQNDLQSYRKFLAGLLERLGQTQDPDLANKLAWLCVLIPNAVTDRELPVKLAELAVKDEPKTSLNTWGAALYRAGHYEDAIKKLNTSVEIRKPGTPNDWLFLAMACQRAGKSKDAQKWLKQAVGLIDKLEKEKISWNNLSWTRRLELQLLRREAEKTVTANP